MQVVAQAFATLSQRPVVETHQPNNNNNNLECSAGVRRIPGICTVTFAQSNQFSNSRKFIEAENDKLHNRSVAWHVLTLEENIRALEKGPVPNVSAEDIISILEICSNERDLACAARLHAVVHRQGFISHPLVGYQLILMLVNCGCMQLLEPVFVEAKSWEKPLLSLLINNIVRFGAPFAALVLYSKIDYSHHLELEPQTYVELLKVCAELNCVEQGCNLHSHISIKGLLQSDAVVGNSLLSMYAKCNELSKAKDLFNELPLRNVASWNALIAGYAKQGHGLEALGFFSRMQEEGFSPNIITFICVLKACCSVADVNKGQEIHAEMARRRLLKQSGHLCNTLLDMYAKCGCIAKAQEVFDSMAQINVIAWNTLITGYTEHGEGKKALECIEHLKLQGMTPDAFTYACSLKACGIAIAVDRGLAVHAEVFRNGLLEKDYMIASALVDMYAKVGLLAKAQIVFDNLPFRDVISWTSLIAGYAEHGPEEQALSCFDEMRREGIFPNAVTFLCCLKACSSLGALVKGSEIHEMIAKEAYLERDLLVGSTLVDMYAKCGSIHKAEDVFGRLLARDVIAWNALLAGYAQAGKHEQLFHCYGTMHSEGTKPNAVTFTLLLSACNHLALVDKSLDYYGKMIEDFAIIPTVDHLASMIDLLGRSGLLEKVVAMMNKIPVKPDLVVWLAVLSACQKWKNVEVGRWAFELALQLDYKCPSAYICMGLIYADAGLQEDANKVEAMRLKNQAWNADLESCWWRDAMGFIHKFTLGDRHLLKDDVRSKLKDLFDKINSNLGVNGVVEDAMIPNLFCEHNERFAVAFALVNTPRRTSIHVRKNVRICDNCHKAMALISEIEQCKLVVDDINQQHIFLKGRCSCKGYW